MRKATTLVAILLAACWPAGCVAPQPTPPEEPAWRNPFLDTGDVVVQVDAVPDREPSPQALDEFAALMREVGSRPSFVVRSGLPGGQAVYTDADLIRMHQETYGGNATTWRDASGRPVLHLMFLDGQGANAHTNGSELGVALFTHPVIAIFHDRLQTLSLFATNVRVDGMAGAEFERAVLAHEYGHVLGLVGCGAPELHARQDLEHPCHSRSQDSVMWYAMHDGDLMQWAIEDGRGPVWRFDEDDWADIRAAQAASRDDATAARGRF